SSRPPGPARGPRPTARSPRRSSRRCRARSTRETAPWQEFHTRAEGRFLGSPGNRGARGGDGSGVPLLLGPLAPAGAAPVAPTARSVLAALLAALLTATTAGVVTATAATLTAATLATAAVGPGLAEVLDLLRVQARAGALGARQPALGPLGDVQVGEEVRAGGVGLHRLGDAQVERLVDHRPLG